MQRAACIIRENYRKQRCCTDSRHYKNNAHVHVPFLLTGQYTCVRACVRYKTHDVQILPSQQKNGPHTLRGTCIAKSAKMERDHAIFMVSLRSNASLLANLSYQ